MARVLITPLGVGDTDSDVYKRQYRTAEYKFEGDAEKIKSPFIISVLTKKLKVDKVIVIGTAKSMWEKLYEYYAKEIKEFDEEYWADIGEKVGKSRYDYYALSENDLKKVEEVIDKYLKRINPNATGGSKCKIIKYGINKDEIWENFDLFMRLIDEINDGDEIYLDITHSFRSIPLFMYVMLEFMRYFKNVKLKGIFYGMLDVIKELGHAPVVDLSPIFEVSEWIRGMYEFTTYGNGYLISKLLESEDKEIAEKLQKISIYIDANYLKELREEMKNLKPLLNNKKNEGKFLKYFIPELEKFSNEFINLKSNFEFQLFMAKQNFKNKKYSSGYLCLTDSIFWKLCELYGIPPNYENRDTMKRIMYNLDIPPFKDIREVYGKLREIRNKIAHADVSKVGNKFNPEDDVKIVENIFENTPNITFNEIIEELKFKVKNNIKDENCGQYLKLLKNILNIQIIKKIIEAYNFENSEVFWNFVIKNLLHKNNKCRNDKLTYTIELFHKREMDINELEEAFNFLEDIKPEELRDSLALFNAIMHYSIFKLSNAYETQSKEHKDAIKWVLLNRRLCSKNPLLAEINNLYYKIYKNKDEQINREILIASKNLIKLLNSDLSKIKEDIPLRLVVDEYREYKKHRWYYA